MARPVVSESALRELLREALENVDARGHDAPAPAVTPNPAMDRASLELDLNPIEVRHVPRGKNELIIMVRNLLDTTDDEQSGELYKKIKSLIGGDDTGKKDFAKATELPPSDASDAVSYRSNDMKKNNMGEATLADAIRDIVQEALAENETVDKPVTSLGEAIRHIAAEALEEAKKKGKKGLPDSFKKNLFKKKGKAKNEADGLPEKGLPTKGKKKTKTSDFGGGSLAEAIRDIAANVLSEADEIEELVRLGGKDSHAIRQSTPVGSGAVAAQAKNQKSRDWVAKDFAAKKAAARGGDTGMAAGMRKTVSQAGAPQTADRLGKTAMAQNPGRGGLVADESDNLEEFDEMDEANYDAAVAEADGKLPWGFGKGKFMGHGGFDTSRPGDENDLEGPPSDTFRARGGSAEDEFNADGTINFDPNEDISDPEELEAVLAKLTKSAWDPEDDDDGEAPAAPAGKKSPKPRIDAGTGYGVDGDTFEKIGEKLGFTPEAAKKAVAVAQERFKVLHDMDPDDMAELVMTGVDEYIGMLAKTGELDDADVKYLHDNGDQVENSDNFREFFSKFVKRAAREQRADTQDDGDD